MGLLNKNLKEFGKNAIAGVLPALITLHCDFIKTELTMDIIRGIFQFFFGPAIS